MRKPALLLLLLTVVALAQTPQPKVVFAVAGPESIEPVVVVEGGQLVGPCDSLDAHDMGLKGLQFIDDYYAKGATYRLLSGGTATVVDSSGARSMAELLAAGTGGAWSLAARVKFQPASARGLAVNYPPPARPASPPDKAALTRALRALLGPRAALTGALARDLDHDGTPEQLGTAKLGKAGAFVILQKNGQILFQKKVVEAHTLEVMDSLNLVGDSTDEVVIRDNGYESWLYEVLQRQNGHWKSVFQGSGGGS